MANIRLIKDSEVTDGAWLLAESFVHYPLLTTIFPNDKKRLQQSFYFFWFYVYTRRTYTYISDDFHMLITLIKPKDKESSCIPLLFNPKFTFGVLRHIPLLPVLPKVIDYLSKMDQMAKRHYNPKTDQYVEMMAIRESKRGGRYMFETIRALDDGLPTYCETLSDKNMRGYQFLRFKPVEEMDWRGCKIYALKRDKKEKKEKKEQCQEA